MTMADESMVVRIDGIVCGKCIDRIRVDGLDMEGCASRIRRALAKVAGVAQVKVDQVEGFAEVHWAGEEKPLAEDIRAALDDAGFRVTAIEA